MILSQFFVMLVFLFCKLSEQHCQTHLSIIKTKPFKVTKYKKGWRIFRPKWAKIKTSLSFYFIFVIKKLEQRHTLQIHIMEK